MARRKSQWTFTPGSFCQFFVRAKGDPTRQLTVSDSESSGTATSSLPRTATRLRRSGHGQTDDAGAELGPAGLQNWPSS